VHGLDLRRAGSLRNNIGIRNICVYGQVIDILNKLEEYFYYLNFWELTLLWYHFRQVSDEQRPRQQP
jgi:hypothetical protein